MMSGLSSAVAERLVRKINDAIQATHFTERTVAFYAVLFNRRNAGTLERSERFTVRGSRFAFHGERGRVPVVSTLLELRDLTIAFETGGALVPAVRNFSLQLEAGASLAIVGESGSGKSVTALALTRLLPASARVRGDIFFEGRSIFRTSLREIRRIRGSQIAYIFQEPGTSLNPVFSIYDQMAETIRLHRPELRDVRREVIYWLDQVGITEPEQRARDYPFQLSGGMQQRVMIAMALCGRPKILVADEPTTALDVTIQKQILDLFRELKQRFAMSILLITHNFGVIQGIADQVAVMFRGCLVEAGQTAHILRAASHPYTKALIDCVPQLGSNARRLKTIDYALFPEVVQ
jgi:ABC-type dipeptide/oligopeptide/nickel transport system ATPase component